MGLPQGALHLLILKARALERQHSRAISERTQQVSAGALNVNQDRSVPRWMRGAGESAVNRLHDH